MLLRNKTLLMAALNKKKYTNIVVNGNFEIDSNDDGLADNWIGDESIIFTMDNTKRYDGVFSQKAQNSIAFYQYLSESLVLPDHIYYAAVFLYMETSGVCGLAIDSLTWDNWVDRNNVDNSNQWEKSSQVFTGRNGCIFFVWGNASIANADCAILIDLTLEFGAGNEPTLEWCDENIDLIISSMNW